MLILCEYCDIRCICYDDWMEHLLSSRHQEVVSDAINSWDSSLNQRSLLVTITGTKPDKVDLCWYFANYGLVADAFFEADLGFCVIQLDKKDYARTAVSGKHTMEGVKLSVRLREDVSDNEWLLLNSMVRRNATKDMAQRKTESFEERHLKLTETLKSFPLDYQIERFEREIKMNSVELSVREKLVQEMNRLFSRMIKFPNCILCPFGSHVTGLGNNSSVLNIYFDAIGECVGKKRDKEDNANPYWRQTLEVVQQYIHSCNRKDNLFCYDLISLPRDSNPCIKFIHYVTGVKCRFTFETLLPVRTSKLIALVMKLDPRLPALFQFVKYWGEYHKLTGPQKLTTYSLYLLLLVYLTLQKIIPSVSVLQSMSTSSEKVSDWETSFSDDIEKISNLMSFFGTKGNCDKNDTTGKPTARSVLQLVVDFCKLYAHSDLQSLVICPCIGELLPKSAFESGKEDMLPKGLEAYKSWASGRKHKLNTKTLLCIQDPFYLRRNISSETPEDIVWKFQFVCADTVDNIEAVLNSQSPNLMEIFNPRAKKEVPSTTPSAGDSNEILNPVGDRLVAGNSNTSLDSISDDSPILGAPHHLQDYTENPPMKTAPVTLCPINVNLPPPNWNPGYSMPPQPHPFPRFNHPYEPSNEVFQQPQYLNQYANSCTVVERISSPELFPQEFPSVHVEPSDRKIRKSSHRTLVHISSSRSSKSTSSPTEKAALEFSKYEKILTYSPTNEFVRMFKKYFGNLVLESAMKIRLKVLWCLFLEEFFSEVYTKAFPFKVEDVEADCVVLNTYKPTREEEGTSSTSLIHSLDKPPDPKKRKNEADERYKYPPQSNPFKPKFFELHISFACTRAFICRVNSNCLINRGKIRSRAKEESHLVKQFPNPMEWEGEVSRRTFVADKGRRTPFIGQFVCKVTMDASDDKCATVVLKVVKGDSKQVDTIENVTDHIISVFRDLVPKYQIFRLSKWLENAR